MSDLYNSGEYWLRYPTWHSEDSAWKAFHLHSLLDEEILSSMRSRTMRVAEFGCGYGGVLAGLVAYLESDGIRCHATGYDISTHAIAEAERRYPHINFIREDFTTGTDYYDLGLLVDILEHVESPLTLLRRTAQRFNWVLCHIPLEEHLLGRMYHLGDYYQYLRERRGHLHCFTRETAVELLREGGLLVNRLKYTPSGIELPWLTGGRMGPAWRAARAFGFRLCPDLSVRVLGGASLACLCTSRSFRRINRAG